MPNDDHHDEDEKRLKCSPSLSSYLHLLFILIDVERAKKIVRTVVIRHSRTSTEVKEALKRTRIECTGISMFVIPLGKNGPACIKINWNDKRFNDKNDLTHIETEEKNGNLCKKIITENDTHAYTLRKNGSALANKPFRESWNRTREICQAKVLDVEFCFPFFEYEISTRCCHSHTHTHSASMFATL